MLIPLGTTGSVSPSVLCWDCGLFITCPSPIVKETRTCNITALCEQCLPPRCGDREFGFLPICCFYRSFSMWRHLPARGVESVWGCFLSPVLMSSGWDAGLLTSLVSGTDHMTMMASEAGSVLIRSSALIAFVTPMGDMQVLF